MATTCFVMSSMPGMRAALEAASAGSVDVRYVDAGTAAVTTSADGLVSFGGAAVLLCEQKQLVEAAKDARGFDPSLKWYVSRTRPRAPRAVRDRVTDVACVPSG